MDTETTGFDPDRGDRVIEVAAVEIQARRVTGATWQRYLNPGRASNPGALKVHGLTEAFLADKPVFEDVVDEFLGVVKGATLVFHNAPFDLAHLNAELARCGRGSLLHYAAAVIDTLPIARNENPGKRASLDSLCDRYGVSRAGRTLHGALLDSHLLAEVYLYLTREQQGFDLLLPGADTGPVVLPSDAGGGPGRLLVRQANMAECAAHEAYMQDLARASAGQTVWS